MRAQDRLVKRVDTMALTHTGTERIETDRMVLRKFEYDDNESMCRHWISDILVQKMYSEPTYTAQEEVKKATGHIYTIVHARSLLQMGHYPARGNGLHWPNCLFYDRREKSLWRNRILHRTRVSKQRLCYTGDPAIWL